MLYQMMLAGKHKEFTELVYNVRLKEFVYTCSIDLVLLLCINKYYTYFIPTWLGCRCCIWKGSQQEANLAVG